MFTKATIVAGNMGGINMKHTPGPWMVGAYPDRDGVSFSVQEVGDSTGWKQKYPHAYLAVSGGWGYCEEAKANMQLMAAAPELLDALKSIDRWLNGPGLIGPSGFMHDRVRAAIAKAEGK
jgi:hypothetical protein